MPELAANVPRLDASMPRASMPSSHPHREPLKYSKSPPRSLPSRLAILPFILLIRAYQATLRPFMGGQCRFSPTCSDYGLEAYRTHGAIRGTSLTARRIFRCRPWGGSGYDPVPPAPPPLPAGEVSRVRE